MKKDLIVSINIIIVVVLLFTGFCLNPDRNDYTKWIRDTSVKKNNEIMERALVVFGMQNIEQSTRVKDFIVFSVFTTDMNGYKFRVIGAFSRIIPLQSNITEDQEDVL